MQAKRLNIMMALALLAVAACSPNLGNIGKESDPTRFYTLMPQAMAPAADARQYPELVVGVGPVSVADYLDRSHIVIRETDTRLNLSEFDRWAAKPGKEVERVLGMNLGVLLGTEQIVTYPWKADIAPSYVAEVTLNRFEYAGGKVYLDANWQLSSGSDVLAFHHTALEQASDGDYGAISSNLSVLTGQLAQEIATGLRGMANSVPSQPRR